MNKRKPDMITTRVKDVTRMINNSIRLLSKTHNVQVMDVVSRLRECAVDLKDPSVRNLIAESVTLRSLQG